MAREGFRKEVCWLGLRGFMPASRGVPPPRVPGQVLQGTTDTFYVLRFAGRLYARGA